MRMRSRKNRRGDDRHRTEGGGVTRGTPSLVCSSKVDDVPHLSEWIPDLQVGQGEMCHVAFPYHAKCRVC
ncbi:unnamed protein product, partial [Closterium sp. Naga37s-1]